MRWIGYTFGALLLLLVLVLIGLALVPGGWVGDRAERFAAESLGIPLEIGELELDLLSTTPGATARNVEVGDGEGGTIVSGADVAIELDAGSLIGGEPVVERLALSGARVDLAVDEEGRGNWESLLAAGRGTEDEPTDPEADPPGIPRIRSLEVDDVSVDFVDELRGREASLTLSARGSTTDPERPLELEAEGRVDGVDVLADVALTPRGDPFADDGSLGVDGSVRAGDTELALEGSIDDPATLDGLELTLSLDAPDGEDIEALAGVELPGLGPVRLDGRVASEAGEWTLREVSGGIGDTSFELDGTIGDPLAEGGLVPDLAFSLSAPDGDDVAPLVETFAGVELPPLPGFAASGAVTAGEGGEWTLRDVTATVGETELAIDGTIGDPMVEGGLAPDLAFSLSAPDGDDVAPLIETFAEVELPPLPGFAASGAVASERGEWVLRDVEASFGEIDLRASGSLGDPLGPDGLDPRVDFALDVPTLRDVEAIAGTELPALPPIAFSAGLRRDGEDWVLRRFDAEVGDSVFEGDVRVDPTTTPPTVFANLVSRELHLDELTDVFGDAADGDAPAGTTEVTPLETREGWLPDEPLGLRPLVRAVDGAVRIRVRRIVSGSVPLESFAGRVEIDGDELALSSLKLGVGGGTVAGSVDLDVGPVPAEGALELRVRSIDLKKVVRTLGIDEDSFGAIGGRAKYWFAGDSVSELLGNADGGLYLLMSGGGLDALLVELAGLDIVESFILAVDPGKTLTRIDCGYLDLQTADGVSDIATFVLETADTVFRVDGTIDLKTEAFDIVAEPHPKDASLIDLSTAVRVRGSPGDIGVVPGVELGARAVAAAALATVAAPVAALLAFVETGDGESSPYCDGFVEGVVESR